MITFPVTYSSLDPKALLQLLLDKWDILPGSTITFIKRGFNDTYLIIQPDGKKYILRVYNAHWRNYNSINTEIVMLSILGFSTDLKISFPIGCKKLKSIGTNIKAPEGVRRIFLFSYAEGKPVRKLSTEQSFLLGKEIAKFHQKALIFKGSTFRNVYNVSVQFAITFSMLKPILVDYPEQYKYLEDLEKDFSDTFKNIDKTELPIGICHGDLQAENIHFTHDNNFTIFDFDFMGQGYLAYDIGVFIWYDHKNKTPKIIKSFIQGYNTIRQLTDTEINLLHYFSTLRAVFQMTLFSGTNNGYYLPQWPPAEIAAFVNKIKAWHEKKQTFS